MNKENLGKFKSYAGQFFLVAIAALAAIWAYDYFNKPKTSAPATAPAPPTTTPA